MSYPVGVERQPVNIPISQTRAFKSSRIDTDPADGASFDESIRPLFGKGTITRQYSKSLTNNLSNLI